MISVKDFAAARGKTNQAVYQQMKRKTNKALLEGHVQKINGIMYLDDAAVAILDAAHDEAPAVVMTENKDERIKDLEAANKLLLEKLDKLHDKYDELVEWKAANVELIAQTEKNQQLLEISIKNAVEEAEKNLQEKHETEISGLTSERDNWKNEAESYERTFFGFYRKK